MGIKYGTENSISLLNKDTKSITIGGYTFEYDKVYRYDRPENQVISPELQVNIKDQLIEFIVLSGIIDISSIPNFATKDYILPDDFDWNWNLTIKDKYGLQGSLTKRISNYYFKKFKIRISADVMSIIGNKLNNVLTSEATVYFDMTNNLERGRDYFYNGSSCWFGNASNGRYFLMDFGGGAIRLLSDEKGSFPVGRCWFCPILDGKALVLFNEYGQAGLFSYARMLANISGLSYKKIVLYNKDDIVYINHYDNNYIIGPVDIISESDYNLPSPKIKGDYHSYVCTKCARYYSKNRMLANTLNTYYYQGLCVNCGGE